MKTPREFLSDLRDEIEAHPAVNHLFLNRLATSPMSRQDYRVFAENHYPLVCAFTTYMELLLLRAPDSEARLWLSRVLVDEYGEGSEGKDHPTLYASFVDACGGDSGRLGPERLPSPAHAFIQAHQRLVRRGTFLEGLGAVGPGHEWAIPKMFDAIVPGLRRAGLSDDQIGYFTLHLEQDEDHGAWLEEALVRTAGTPEAQAQVRRGALTSLEARMRFWDGVQAAVIRYRQPRATRADGPSPRTLLHEVALTSWDGMTMGRALETWRARRATDARPTLDGMLLACRSLT
ncbi:MAG: iron-containing redox enzyme family protein [Myxococcales bacterium]|nr:iron-containing redox enzyme family protein [Myxococcales bacterium]